MYDLEIHKDAIKTLQKAPNTIKEKAFLAISELQTKGINPHPFPSKKLKGYHKKFTYFESKIAKDFRIIFRFEDNKLLVRKAGTHNYLGTG
jgi:mRNA-degrading endonuclease RelE of RelBE toxin-antitoxin system